MSSSRALLVSSLLVALSAATPSFAQSFSESGWTLLYNQSTANNTTAVAIGPTGVVYWGTYDNPTTLRSRSLKGRVATLHHTAVITGIAAVGNHVYFTTDSTNTMQRLVPGQVPTTFVADFRPSSSGDDDPAGIERVPTGFTTTTYNGQSVAAGDFLVVDFGGNDVVYRVPAAGGTPAIIGTDQSTYDTLVDVAATTSAIYFIDREDPTLFRLNTNGGSTAQTITGTFSGEPVGLEWDRVTDTLIVALNASGSNDTLVRLTSTGANSWSSTVIASGFAFDGDATQVLDISDDGTILVVAQNNSVRAYARCGLASAADCNNNNVADVCDVVNNTAPDCNDNTRPDSCDIAQQVSTDCDQNGIPDECRSCGAPVQLVFAVDTSGSMDDESALICSNLSGIITELAAEGITVDATLYAIGLDANDAYFDDPEGDFDCLENHIGAVLGTAVPNNPPPTGAFNQNTLYQGCGGANATANQEDWGRGTSVLAGEFPWSNNAIRLIVNVSDELPWCGTDVNGGNQADSDSITYAIQNAQANDVIVSTILASGYHTTNNQPMEALAVSLANGTGGTVSRELAGPELVEAIKGIVRDACVADQDCDGNGQPDLCEIAAGAPDCNNNGRLDICENVVCNLPPTANPDSGFTARNTALTMSPAVTQNDTDPEGAINPASVDLNPSQGGIQTSVSVPGGTFTVAANGVVTFVPAPDFVGFAVATYTVADTQGARSLPTTITVEVIYCLDTGGPSEVDAGCGGTTPICDVSNPSNRVCVECTVNADCLSPAGPGGGLVSGIEVCASDKTCVGCEDTQAYPGVDFGCTTGLPVCDDRVLDDEGCVACFDDKPGTQIDNGCVASDPICDESIEGGRCAPCIDTGAGTDLGCSDLTPFCQADQGGERRCQECRTDDDCIGEELCDADGLCIDLGSTVAVPDSYRTAVGVPVVTTSVDGVMANDLLPTGTSGTVSLLSTPPPSQGSLTLAPDGAFSFVPAGGFVGTVTFGYRLANAITGGFSDTTVTIVVNGPPDAQPDQVTTAEDTPVVFTPTANDVDPNGDPVTLDAIVTPPAHGTLEIGPDGAMTYTPAPDYHGPDSARYRVCDPEGLCAEAPISITVTPVDDPPVIKDDLTTTPEDVAVLVVVLSNDADPEGEALTVSRIVRAADHGATEIRPDGTVLYTPRADFVGADAFVYEACDLADPIAVCATATVFVTVTPVNDAPVAAADATTTPAATAVTIDVLANDSDVDGDTLIVRRVVFSPESGSAALVDGRIRYTPAAGFTGVDRFVYEVCDPSGLCDQAEVRVTVGVANRPPSAVDDTATTLAGTSVVVNVGANDSDPDGDPLSVTQVGVPANGTAVIVNGNVVYTPYAGFSGTETFSYTTCDPVGACASATIRVEVVPAGNRPPLASDDVVNTTVDQAITFDPTANDLDPDGDPLTVAAIITQPAHGSATPVGDRNVAYTPAPGFIGVDVFALTIEDGRGGSDVSLVTVYVTAEPNRRPDAVDDRYEVPGPAVMQLDVLLNDSDADGDDLIIVDVVQPRMGSVSVLASVLPPASGLSNGKLLELTPAPGATGTDTFSYTVSDGRGGFDSAIVTLIHPTPNRPPDAIGDIVTTPEDVAVLIVVTSNDLEPDGEPLALDAITEAPRHGTAIISHGAVLYTPAPDYNGPDVFSYRVCDPHGACDSAAVSLTVLPVNDPPRAGDDFVSLPADEASIIDVVLNDADPELDPLDVTAIAVPADNGTAFINPDGTITYEPDQGFIGTDTFAYEVCDIFDACDTAVVTVFIGDGNTTPTPVDDQAFTDEGTPVNVDVLDNDTDPDGDPLTIGALEDPPHGTAVIEPDGTITYTPDADFVGEEVFYYTACDPSGACGVAFVVVIVIDGENVPPVAVDDTFQTPEGTPITFDTRGNDFDFDGDPLTVIAVGTPQHGQALLRSDSTITYQPDPGFIGNDTFTVTISDGRGGVATQNVLIIVTPGDNLPPDARDDFFHVPSGGETRLPVRDNDIDPDGDPLIIVDVEQPAHGTVTIGADGDLVIVPDANYIGPDRFCYTVSDQNGGFDSACVEIVIGDRDGDGLGDEHEVAIVGTDPDDPDTDGDGLWDGDEIAAGDPLVYEPGIDTNPLDADTDDDGISDGDEVNGSGPLADFGPTDPLDPDTDNDRIPDGIEVGVTEPVAGGTSNEGVPYAGTDINVWRPDADPTTRTDPRDDDSDDDGIKDGTEDANQNGAWEGVIGGTGTAGEGETDPLDVDTDGDGIQDGTELGLTQPEGVHTDLAIFKPDLDPTTTTDPRDTDTDDGGVPDGVEDPNGNGYVDPGEIDPNFGDDDTRIDDAQAFIAEGGGCAGAGGLAGLGLAWLALALLARARRRGASAR